jgi:hypothetical protein
VILTGHIPNFAASMEFAGHSLTLTHPGPPALTVFRILCNQCESKGLSRSVPSCTT